MLLYGFSLGDTSKLNIMPLWEKAKELKLNICDEYEINRAEYPEDYGDMTPAEFVKEHYANGNGGEGIPSFIADVIDAAEFNGKYCIIDAVDDYFEQPIIGISVTAPWDYPELLRTMSQDVFDTIMERYAKMLGIEADYPMGYITALEVEE